MATKKKTSKKTEHTYVAFVELASELKEAAFKTATLGSLRPARKLANFPNKHAISNAIGTINFSSLVDDATFFVFVTDVAFSHGGKTLGVAFEVVYSGTDKEFDHQYLSYIDYDFSHTTGGVISAVISEARDKAYDEYRAYILEDNDKQN